MEKLKVFVGWDPREIVAHDVAVNSMRLRTDSAEIFSISRFCIPFLTKGWAVFTDSDVVCLTDIAKIMESADDKYAVMCVKHDYVPKEKIIHVNMQQTTYFRKNWASVMLINCDHPAHKNLTKEMLNTLPGRELHRFCWLKDEEIGELSPEWNHLVNVNPPIDKINIAHYTLGGPWVPGWTPSRLDEIWNEEYVKFQDKQLA